MERYSGSKSKAGETKNLKDFRDTTKRYLEHLEKWLIVREEDAHNKNRIKGRLYRYGRVGLIIARILEYRRSLDKSDDSGKQEAKNEIFGLIQRMLKDPKTYNSYKEVFLAEFYHKIMEHDNNNKDNQPGLCDSVISIMGIFAASLAVVVTLGEFRIFSMAQAQGNITSSSSLTPEQKAAICAPGDTHVNATESKICGIPMTPSSNSTSTENATAAAETPSSPPTAAAPSTGE
jgi:hypothetical protein